MAESTKSNKSAESIFKTLAWVLITVGAVSFIGAALLFYFKTGAKQIGSDIDPDVFGSLGSLVSGISGAMWSLAGIFLFYAALQLQREDLNTQREELKKTREASEEQGKTLKIQRFENTFFQMLTLHHTLTKSIQIDDWGVGIERDKLSGRDAIKLCYNHLRREYETVDNVRMVSNKPALRKMDNSTVLKAAYADFYKKYRSLLDHYFRSIFEVLSLIDSSQLENGQFYANILRANISGDEQLLIFYYGLHYPGNLTLKALIEKYSLLRDLPINNLLNLSHRNLYKFSAFGGESISGNEFLDSESIFTRLILDDK